MEYTILRDEKIKMILSSPTIRADGTIWQSGCPLLGAQDCDKKALADIVRRKAWAEIPAHAWTRMGVNANGLTVIDSDEYQAQQRAKITPAQRERAEIATLFCQAVSLANSDSEDNVWHPAQMRSQAKARLEAWQVKYPAEAAQERAQELRNKADSLRFKARGAMTYDADGWLSRADQQASHDQLVKQAEALEAEAAMMEVR